MSKILLGQYAYRRGDGRLPSVRLRNVFFEQSPSTPDNVALLTRPTLDPFATVGDGPNRGIFWEDDVFADAALIASGNILYSTTQEGVSTPLGAITGSGRVEVAYSPTEALVASGGVLQVSDGVTLAIKSFPDSLNVVSVGFINGYFLAVPENSHRIYYTDLTTGEFDGTRFISAERYPDNVSRIIITSDEVWAMGSSSVEVMVPTGVDAVDQPPFQRVEGRLYKKGVLNAATIVEADNSVYWVGFSKDAGFAVYRGDGVPVAVSDPSIAERISRCDPTLIKAWVFGSEGHSFYVLSLNTEGTWAYDLKTGGWFEWASINRDQWRAHLGRSCWPGVVLAGDDETAQVWQISTTGTDDGGEVIEQKFTAGTPIDGRITNSNVSLDCAVGQVAVGETAAINLEYSDDQGRTWTDEGECSLGLIGDYETRVRWNRMGMMRPPSRIFEWTTTSPVRMRVSGARLNDSY